MILRIYYITIFIIINKYLISIQKILNLFLIYYIFKFFFELLSLFKHDSVDGQIFMIGLLTDFIIVIFSFYAFIELL